MLSSNLYQSEVLLDGVRDDGFPGIGPGVVLKQIL
jgi:hypothetical protein